MSYTEVTSVGWFGRIRDSIAGIGCGFLLFILAFPLLWWNEGRAVAEATGIAAARKAVVEAEPSKVDPANEGKLIHLSGPVSTTQKLVDDVTKFELPALRLRRKVEISQWEEKKKTETRKKVGGGEDKITTYTYQQIWSDKVLSSASYKESGHNNTGTLPCEGKTDNNQAGMLGSYKLGEAISHFEDFEPVPVARDQQPHLSPPDGFKVEASDLYKGQDSGHPAIGDVKITFLAVQPGDYTIMAGQKGDSFTTFMAAEKPVLEVKKGNFTAAQMFKDMEDNNAMMSWILRLVGFLMMFIGVTMALKPLSVMFDVLPFLGNIVEFGAALAGIAIAVPCTLLVIALAWVAHRPILGIGLLVLVGVSIFLARSKMKKSPG